MGFQNKMRQWQLKYSRYAPQNLMMYIVGAMALVYIADYILAPTVGFSLSRLFMFTRSEVLAGQIWRGFTFTFLPPNSSLLFIVFSLYFYYLIGTALEREWGSFWFDIYYLCGVIGTIAAGFITGSATNYYLNMSLFFAFAALYPNFQVMLFFFLPIKIKWLAYLDAAFFLVNFLVGSWPVRAAILASLFNFFLFFGPSFFRGIRDEIRTRRRRAQFNREYRGGVDDRNRWN